MQSKPWGCFLDPAKETEGVAVDLDMAGEMHCSYLERRVAKRNA